MADLSSGPVGLSAPKPVARRTVAVWPWPIVLGVLTLTGLLSALLGQQGGWLVASWACLSFPLIVVGACLVRAWRGPSFKGGPS